MEVPADVLYGASTQRAVLNFPISGRPVPAQVIKAYGMLKAACATVNARLGRLPSAKAEAIIEACQEIRDGLPAFGGLHRHFPIDIFQTGSGTSTNMNVNEVIANLVCVRHHKPIGSSKDPAWTQGSGPGVHPNDHVNMGQSSNDTFPTAMHLAAAIQIAHELLPAVRILAEALESKARDWDRVVKIGRTHLQDATPIRLGQEFSGFASQVRHAEERLHRALHTLSELPIGGTAVGTGINTHEQFGAMVAAELVAMTAGTAGPPVGPASHAPGTAHPSPHPAYPSDPAAITSPGGGVRSATTRGIHFREAQNHFEAQHAKDAIVETSAHLRTLAVSLTKIASDIRLMGCGPRCGIGELLIPAVQPGSSIMPGKVNPVIIEAVIMVCCQVLGNDHAVCIGGLGGVGGLLDLNVAMPMMIANLLDSAHLLTRACLVFTDHCLKDLKADQQRCQSLIEGSLAMCTSLVPVIGYDKAAALAKQAYAEGKTIRALALEQRLLPKDDLDRLLDPWSMTLPGGEGSAGG
jgi:fumarate hydratase class II